MSGNSGSHRFIFICGLHRSGTSLLQRFLQSHAKVSGFSGTGAPEDEGQHLQSVYAPARVYGGPGKFCFTPDAYLTETSPLVTAANRDKLFSEWSRHWDLSKPLLLEKSPPNIIRSRFLQAMFPESYFIFITRHPLAVSLATQKWSHTGIPELVEHWCLAHQTMRDDTALLSRHLWLRYEDFVADPSHAVARLASFLGIEPWTPNQPLSDHNPDYFRQWEKLGAEKPQMQKKVMNFAELPTQFSYSLQAPYVTY